MENRTALTAPSWQPVRQEIKEQPQMIYIPLPADRLQAIELVERQDAAIKWAVTAGLTVICAIALSLLLLLAARPGPTSAGGAWLDMLFVAAVGAYWLVGVIVLWKRELVVTLRIKAQ